MILEVLTAEGHEVDVLTFPEGEDPGIPASRVHRIKAPAWTRGIRPGFSFRKLACDAIMLKDVLRRVRGGDYDLVHAVEESAFMALAARWLFRVPYVYDMDSGLAQQMVDRFPALRWVRRLLEACEGMAVRGSAGTLAVCGSLEERARASAPEGLVACLEDISLLDGSTECPADIRPPEWRDHPLVLYVGNLEPYQGIDLLLAAFARTVGQVPEAKLAVVGGHEEGIDHYRRESERLGLADSVHFAGPRPVAELDGCLRQATALVSPRTQGHNTPMKIYSYLDSGRPLLATRLPTHTQVLDDEVALLVEPEPEAMGHGLARLLRDEVLRERLAANARRLAQREFTPEAFRRKLLGFYGDVARRIGHDGNYDGQTAGTQARRPGRR
ncbi:MAG TPA: glycosyltransferase family 4 protein [Thermoanaerobaculia bacterium]|nr:glycosyltransferase family 4 protein [Thermoanaerobaculia bacterium]